MRTPAVVIGSALAILVVLIGCGGGSGGSSPSARPTLYVGDIGVDGVYIWRNDDALDGNVPPSSEIGGVVNAQIDSPYGVGYDSRGDTLIVGDFGNGVIKFFDGVTALDGDVAPTRVLGGPATLLLPDGNYEHVVDETRDLLYVSYDDGVLVFGSAATIDGNIAPARNITGPATGFSSNQDKRLFLDASNDRLYVLDSGAASVMVFDGASARNGNTAPNRTIAGGNTGFSYPWGIAVDVARNVLYVSDETNDEVYAFDGASTANGNLAPDRTLTGPATMLQGPAGIDVDPATNSLYVTNFPGGSGGVSIWSGASTADGAVAPTRVITGIATGLSGPQDITVRR